MKHVGLVAGISVVLAVVISSVFLYFFIPKSGFQSSLIPGQPASINGTVNLNGTVPDGATFSFAQREARSTAPFTTFVNEIPAQDGQRWTFNDGVVGKSYEIQATLYSSDGKTIAQSDPIFVTAPASEEQVVFNIVSETQTGTALISGTVQINGYIPTDATVTVEGRQVGNLAYTTIASNLPAINNQYVSYASAISGKEYQLRATLYDKNKQAIGTSKVLVVSAPAQNEVLQLNSLAVPPATPIPTAAPNVTSAVSTTAVTPAQAANNAISGSIKFNGAAQINTRIVIFQRVTGTTNFSTAVDNITPIDGVNWRWTGAKAGTTYDIIGILKQHNSNGTDTDISMSNTLTVAAPASSQTLTINSGFALPAQNGTITVTCGNYDTGSKTYAASVAFQTITNAQSYWFEIGTTNGGMELLAETQNATNNPTQAIPASLQPNTSYYARYAYSNVQNAPSSQFSPFSSVTSFRCP